MKCKHPDHVEGVSCEARAVGCHSECPCCMGSYSAEIAKQARETSEYLREVTAEHIAMAIRAAVPFELLVALYNAGYNAGHRDTVETRFTDIHPTELGSCHAEEVHEFLQEEWGNLI
jgi:hypothetical protein